MNLSRKQTVTLPIVPRLITESSLEQQKTKPTKNITTMKTTFYIIATFFGLQSNFLFASGTSAQTYLAEVLRYPVIELTHAVTEVSAINLADLKVLAPVIPGEADFSDNDLAPASVPASITLAPATPKEAGFEDSDLDDLKSLILDLAPVTPSEADFMDTETSMSFEVNNLQPVLPIEASFEEHV